MNDASAALDVLSALRDAGILKPQWDRATDRGFIYSHDGTAIDEDALESLARSDLAERVFTDRISRCPQCRSHALNMREVCTSCKSSNIAPVELLHHFRCGYVAPAYEFPLERDGRRCPKCHGMLRDRGTDHDVPGANFNCRACDRSFQMPEIGAVCMACGHHVQGTELESIVYEDVYGYRLRPRGDAALRSGYRDGGNAPASTPEDRRLLSRESLLALLEDERKRARRFKTTFSVLLVTTDPPANPERGAEADALVATVLNVLSDTDKLGRFDEHRYLALLPEVDAEGAETLARTLSSNERPILRAWAVRASLVEFPGGEFDQDGFELRPAPLSADA